MNSGAAKTTTANAKTEIEICSMTLPFLPLLGQDSLKLILGNAPLQHCLTHTLRIHALPPANNQEKQHDCLFPKKNSCDGGHDSDEGSQMRDDQRPVFEWNRPSRKLQQPEDASGSDGDKKAEP